MCAPISRRRRQIARRTDLARRPLQAHLDARLEHAAILRIVVFDDHASGRYAQGVYKFQPQWRIGYRYSRLKTPDVPIGLLGGALDSAGYNPDAHAVMADWTNSEFSRVRLQYNHEELSRSQDDDQILLQYIMSIGAHGAHKY